jgi:protein-tyrosine phosphatase
VSQATLDEPSLPLVNLIVQLTPLREQKRDKCHPYFPPSTGETWKIPSTLPGGKAIEITLEDKKLEREKNQRISKLSVRWQGEPKREITHIEYLGWGDHGEAAPLFP